MRFSKFFSGLLSFVIILSLVICPQVDLQTSNLPSQITTIDEETDPLQLINRYLFSLDDLLELIEEIEEGEFEKRCSTEELMSVSHLLVYLAKQGMVSGDVKEARDLESDSYALLHPEMTFYDYASSYFEGDYDFSLASDDQFEIELCKGWFKKQTGQAKKYCKKHKKGLIIGGVVVLGIAIGVGVFALSATGAAAAAGAASASGSSATPQHEKQSLSSSSEELIALTQPLEIPILKAIEESPVLNDIIEEKISSFKEMIVENPVFSKIQDRTFGEQVRELGSLLTHDILDTVDRLTSDIPQALEEIYSIGELLCPGLRQNKEVFPETPVENYEKNMAVCHKQIDQMFSTDYADRYTPEGKARGPKNPFAIGVIPPPGFFGGASTIKGTGRLTATQASNVRGWEIGEPIQNRTIFGTIPKWSTVRQRYWKNRAEWAKSNPDHYSSHNIQRMKRGLAPREFNEMTGQMESIELHHIPPQRESGLFDFIEVSPTEHAELDSYRKLKG